MQEPGHSLSSNKKTSKSVYITEHLPHLLYLYVSAKKKIYLYSKRQKNKKEPTKWAIVDGSYCLYTKDVKHTAESINQ